MAMVDARSTEESPFYLEVPPSTPPESDSKLHVVYGLLGLLGLKLHLGVCQLRGLRHPFKCSIKEPTVPKFSSESGIYELTGPKLSSEFSSNGPTGLKPPSESDQPLPAPSFGWSHGIH